MARTSKTIGLSLDPEFRALAKARAKSVGMQFSPYVRALIEADLAERAAGKQGLTLRERPAK